MRWTTDLEDLVSEKLAEGTCPLCGGRIRTRAQYLGNGMRYIEPYCAGCGMVVGEGGYDHKDI